MTKIPKGELGSNLQAFVLDATGWIDVKKKLPDRNTRYAATYGVPVLCFDMQEAKDSGYYVPTEFSFHFEENWFMQLAYSSTGSIWVPADVTHWKELPAVPVPMRFPQIKRSKARCRKK